LSLAIFDVDDTLTMQDTESLWQTYLVYKGMLSEYHLIQKKESFRLAYEAGLLNFHEVIEFSVSPIAHLSLDEQILLQQDFTESVLRTHIIPQAIDLVLSHYNRGDTILIISAGHDFLIPLAASFFPVHSILCSQLQKKSCGSFEAILNGPALYREEKLRALHSWLKKQETIFDTMYFYSDSINDLPLLEFVDIPIAVNPCPRLKQVALARNWPIMDLKELYQPVFKSLFSLA
jgi:HAD superfamily hydrolase (TIGR01490 family)